MPGPFFNKKKHGSNTTASTSRGGIKSYFKNVVDDTLPAVISRMVAKDRLPFEKFCTSYDLRKLLIAKGYSVPKSANSIWNIVMDYGEKPRHEVRREIAYQNKIGNRFSLTFDELK